MQIGRSLFFVLISLWLAGGTFFWLQTQQDYKTPDDIEAIVVLTGGRGRLSDGVSLLHKTKAKYLFISGVYEGTTKQDLKRFLPLSSQEIQCCVTLGYQAYDTQGNAQETQQWIKENNIKEIALVTSNYHMPRSLIEFENIIQGVKIYPAPVKASLFEKPGHYITKLKLFCVEYHKFLGACMRSYWIRWI